MRGRQQSPDGIPVALWAGRRSGKGMFKTSNFGAQRHVRGRGILQGVEFLRSPLTAK
jgi:hypothetical protein